MIRKRSMRRLSAICGLLALVLAACASPLGSSTSITSAPATAALNLTTVSPVTSPVITSLASPAGQETVTPTAPPTTAPTTVPTGITAPPATVVETATTVPAETATAIPPQATAATTDTLATIASLDALVPPRRDQVALAVAYGRTTSTERVARTTPLPDQVGSKVTFWVDNIVKNQPYTTTATLQLALDRVLMYVEDGVQFNPAALERSAREFNDKIYPRERALFGSEWSPGIDGDPRITILNARVEGAGGYFSSRDEVPRSVNRFSNEREMFIIDVNGYPLGSTGYSSTLAHEFQHMIEWAQQHQSSTWMNEGLSELAMQLNGYRASGAAATFIPAPDLQLTGWGSDPGVSAPYYGAAYLFWSYVNERYGKALDFNRLINQGAGQRLDLIAEQARKSRPELRSFDELFADWAVANLINDPALEGGRWSYKYLPATVRPETQPAGQIKGDVAQYGADYIELPQSAAAKAYTFDGSDTVGVFAGTPQGKASWWSNRADDSMTTLTGSFDLSQLKSATLKFRAWYDIEKGYDYAFVSASTDGGKTWRTLPGKYTTKEDPQGANYGFGYTSTSGSEQPEWVDESMDLTPFAGKQIQLRFSMVTDDAYNRPNMVIDDIRIPEINFADDVEQGPGIWQATGWVRTDNQLPQRWQLRLVRFGAGGTRVEPVELDKDNRATARVAAGERVVLVVMATTPHTTERANYTLSPEVQSVSGGTRP